MKHLIRYNEHIGGEDYLTVLSRGMPRFFDIYYETLDELTEHIRIAEYRYQIFEDIEDDDENEINDILTIVTDEGCKFEHTMEDHLESDIVLSSYLCIMKHVDMTIAEFASLCDEVRSRLVSTGLYSDIYGYGQSGQHVTMSIIRQPKSLEVLEREMDMSEGINWKSDKLGEVLDEEERFILKEVLADHTQHRIMVITDGDVYINPGFTTDEDNSFGDIPDDVSIVSVIMNRSRSYPESRWRQDMSEVEERLRANGIFDNYVITSKGAVFRYDDRVNESVDIHDYVPIDNLDDIQYIKMVLNILLDEDYSIHYIDGEEYPVRDLLECHYIYVTRRSGNKTDFRELCQQVSDRLQVTGMFEPVIFSQTYSGHVVGASFYRKLY